MDEGNPAAHAPEFYNPAALDGWEHLYSKSTYRLPIFTASAPFVPAPAAIHRAQQPLPYSLPEIPISVPIF